MSKVDYQTKVLPRISSKVWHLWQFWLWK